MKDFIENVSRSHPFKSKFSHSRLLLVGPHI